MHDIILISVSGEDKPGLTAALTKILDREGMDILDIGQAVIHDWLCLGILVRLPRGRAKDEVIKDLLYRGYELGLKLKFTSVTPDRYAGWVDVQGKPRYIITALGRKVGASHISAISRILADNGLNIAGITRLSGRIPLDQEIPHNRASVEFSVRGTPRNIESMREQFLNLAQELGVDIAFQEDNIFRRNRRMVAFDMDSTLIQAEVIDELAVEAGVGDQVKAITESAMRGEIDFSQSLKKRLALMEGLSAEVLDKVADRLPLTEGAERLIKNLKRFGYKIAIISGGFTYFGEKLQKKLGIDFLHANELEIKDGVVTGKVVGDIVDSAKKAELLTAIAEREGISLQQVIAVGDGANDLPMLNIAGLGIAFHAKPKVKKGADHSISTLGLDAILYLMGVRDREVA